MAISKHLDMKISKGEATLNEDFYVYQHDRGIELRIKANLSRFHFKSSRMRLNFENDSVFVGATILKPNGEVIGRDKIELIDDIIRFEIDRELTDDIDEIGIYKIQFHLYDILDNRITLPPIQFEVKKLLGYIDDNNDEIDVARVDIGQVGYCAVSDESQVIEIFTKEGRYIKTEWASGDIITAEKLNKMESALELFDSKLNSFLDENNSINIEMIPYSTANDSNITSVKDALDKLLYFDLTISISSNKSTTLEKGTVVSDAVFNWSYNKSIASQSFNGISLDNTVRSYTYNDSFSTNKTFILKANDGKKDFSRSIGFNFLNGRYWGVSNSNTYDSNFVKSLSKELSSSRAKTFTVNCGSGQHIFYCIPSSFGTPTFTVGGFSGGFNKIETIQYTNPSGYTESYDIWKSSNSNLGNTTVVVS